MFKDVKVGFLTAKSSIKRGNKKTTIFIIFVLSLIFLNLIFLPSLINGMMKLFVGFVQDYAYGDVVIEPADGNVYINNADNLLAKVRSLNDVEAAAKRLGVGASLAYEQKEVGVTILGVVPSDEEKISLYPYIVKQGDFLGDLSRNEIIIGAMIAGTGPGSEIYDNLGEVKVGSLINATYGNNAKKIYKVKGIQEGTFELTDLNALVSFKELESVLGIEGQHKATSIVIRVQKAGEEAAVKNQILGMGVKEKVFTWQEKAEVLIKQATQSMSTLDIVSKIVSLIIGASLIFIVNYINTLNRKKEIGILKAVGVSPASVIISYIFISLFYVMMGIILGMMLFLFLTLYLQANPITFYGSLKIYPVLEISLLMQSILIMISMSLIAGFLPSWLVTRESILDAIWSRE